MRRTPSGKVVPPRRPSPHVDRSRLLDRLDGALESRLTLVTAGPGAGKSSLLADWAALTPSPVAWFGVDAADGSLARFAGGLVDALRLRLPGLSGETATALEGWLGPQLEEAARAEAFAAALAEAVDGALTGPMVLVIDDVHELAEGEPPAMVLAGLARHAPPDLHLVLASRQEPPFPIHRLRGRGEVLEIEGPELAMDEEEISELLTASLGKDAARFAPAVKGATAGWPVAVRLTVEALRPIPPERRGRAIVATFQPDGPLFAYLAEEVFAGEPEAVRRLVATVAVLDRFTAELCAHLGLEGAAPILRTLQRRGLYLEPHRDIEGWWSLHGPVREFALARMGDLVDGGPALVHRRAATWFLDNGYLEESLASLNRTGDPVAVAELLATRGPELLAGGAVDRVSALGASLPGEVRTPAVVQVLGEAAHILGDWEGALAAFGSLAQREGPLPAGLAWRLGLIHHQRGALAEALAVYERGDISGPPDAEQALLLAWTSTAHWLRGEVDRCRSTAAMAQDMAVACGDLRALAAAHTALAMVAALEGDRQANDAHYLRALDAAERAGDNLQVVRIRSNRASRFLEEGAFAEALAELDVAVPLAEMTGFATFLGLGLHNRGVVHRRLGRLEQAVADEEASRATYQRISSRSVAYPLGGLGDVYRVRGDMALARAAYEEALAAARPAGDVQGLVPALAGLARVLARDEPARAAELAAEAVAFGPGMASVEAHLAAGWVAWSRGDPEEGAACAAVAAGEARARRDRPGLAEALQLEGACATDPARAASLWDEAASLWAEVGEPIGQATAELAAASALRRGTAGTISRAERRLRELGVRPSAAAAAGLLACIELAGPTPAAVHALGGFRVLRDGAPVAPAEWQSKKARDLLKRLVARRGRPMAREQLMESLWPDEEPEKLGNRFSVALSTLRTILDPGKHYDGDHFIAADKESVRLDLDHLSIDVEHFLADAEAGWRLAREGRMDAAVEHWASAEAAYSGDFLEEEPYEDYAVPLREEARAGYVAVARALAEAADRAGDPVGSVRYRLRILERDAYDEEVHIGLVAALAAAGRHGEARRAYRRYVAAMQELGVEPAPLPSAPTPAARPARALA